MRNDDNGLRILAIDPMHKGFGYVVLEEPGLLVDWGVAHVRGPKHSGSIRRLAELVLLYATDAVVIEDPEVDSRRWARVQRLLADIRVWGEKRGVRVRMLSRRRVRKVFAEWNARTKEEIAAVIADRFPELALRLPPHRKCYMSEDVRMSIFDAAALAVTLATARRSAPHIATDRPTNNMLSFDGVGTRL
jgi:hypothetical protein